MKRITCFTESLAGGGAEHQITILAGLLAQKGYEVNLVTYATIPDHYETPDGVKRQDIGYTRLKKHLPKAIIKIVKVFHFFLWLKTDCIISYRQSPNIRLLLPMLFRVHRPKVICGERNTTTSMEWKEKLLFGGLYSIADYIVPNSHTQTIFIKGYRPKLSPKIRTIINYTDLSQFTACELPCDLSVIKIVIFSRFNNQKNPIGFASAMQELKNRSKQKFEVHWYGYQGGEIEGKNIDYIRVRRKIDELGIEDVLKLFPPVKNPALLMSDYHAVCLPSLYEGFSNSVSEGICCGKPMLVSDVSDNSIMVHNGENGFLFNPRDTGSICNAFLKFFGLDNGEMSRMARKSRNIAESLFNKERFVQQYIELIEN